MNLPKALDNQDEALIEMRKNMVGKIYNEYRNAHCDKKDNQQNNLTEEEMEGLESLHKRIQKK